MWWVNQDHLSSQNEPPGPGPSFLTTRFRPVTIIIQPGQANEVERRELHTFHRKAPLFTWDGFGMIGKLLLGENVVPFCEGLGFYV